MSNSIELSFNLSDEDMNKIRLMIREELRGAIGRFGYEQQDEKGGAWTYSESEILRYLENHPYG